MLFIVYSIVLVIEHVVEVAKKVVGQEMVKNFVGEDFVEVEHITTMVERTEAVDAKLIKATTVTVLECILAFPQFSQCKSAFPLLQSYQQFCLCRQSSQRFSP